MRNLDNNGEHILTILGTTDCKKHEASFLSPCWYILPGAENQAVPFLPAVCGARIKKAGFNGKISESSYQTKRDASRKRAASK